MPNRTVPAAAEGLPQSSNTSTTPFYREEHSPTDAALVRKLPTKELLVLFDAMQAMNEALLGIANRPKCDGEIEDVIDEMMTRQSDVCSYIGEELQRRPMSGDKTDDERVMGYVLTWEFKACGCTAVDAIATIAKMKVAHDEVVGEQRRASIAASEARAA